MVGLAHSGISAIVLKRNSAASASLVLLFSAVVACGVWLAFDGVVRDAWSYPLSPFAGQNIIRYNGLNRERILLMSTPKRGRGTPPRYDAAFKEGVVKLVTEQGRTTREVADELGVSADSLHSWLKPPGFLQERPIVLTKTQNASCTAKKGGRRRRLLQSKSAEESLKPKFVNLKSRLRTKMRPSMF